MKFKKLYVRTWGKFNKENMVNMLKNIGINKDFIFSNCNKKCVCKNWKINKDDLEIVFSNEILQFNDNFFKRKWEVFRYGILSNKLELELKSHKELGYHILTFQDFNKIRIYLGNCYEVDVSPLIILKHEILHLNNGEHCKNNLCFMSESDKRFDNIIFCDKCEKKYNKIIKECL